MLFALNVTTLLYVSHTKPPGPLMTLVNVTGLSPMDRWETPLNFTGPPTVTPVLLPPLPL